jgi:hypothetical protein
LQYNDIDHNLLKSGELKTERWLSGRKQRFAKPIQPSLQDPQSKANPLSSQGLAPFLISPDFL